MSGRKEPSEATQRALLIARGVRKLWPFDVDAEGPGSKSPELGGIILAMIFGRKTCQGIVIPDPKSGEEVYLP